MRVIITGLLSLCIMHNAWCTEAPNALPTQNTPPTPPTIIPIAITAPTQEAQNATIQTTPATPVAPIAPTPVATTPAATPQPVPQSATTPNATKSTELTPEIEQEFKILGATLDDIRTAKKELVSILSMLDSKQEEGRAEIVQAQKTTKEILNATQEADAQTLLVKVNENLKKITAIETEISNDLTKKFDDVSKKITDLINKARASIASLQGKGIALQMVQAKLQTLNKEAADLEKNQATKSSQIKEKNAQEKTWWDDFVDFCAKIGHRVKKAFKKIKDLASSSPTTNNDEKKKTSESIIGSQATAPAATEKLSEAVATEMKSNNAKLEEVSAKLQATQNKITATVDELNKQNTELTTTLNIKSQEKIELGDPTWKRISIFIFSEFLDVAAFIVNGTKDICVWMYHKTLGPLITKFTTDVQEKIKKEELKDGATSQPQEKKPTPVQQENSTITPPISATSTPATPDQTTPPATPTLPASPETTPSTTPIPVEVTTPPLDQTIPAPTPETPTPSTPIPVA